jgi:hypothetical protein
MFGKEPESPGFAGALSMALLVVGGFVVFAVWQMPAEPPPSIQATTAVSTVHPISSQVRIATHESETATPPVITTVFECQGDEGRVLSDQPCGGGARLREISAPNRMNAEPIARPHSLAAPERGRKSVSEVGVGSPRGDAAACARIESAVDSINARMRQQYSSQEGEFWRGRLRELSEQRWNAKCRLL